MLVVELPDISKQREAPRAGGESTPRAAGVVKIA